MAVIQRLVSYVNLRQKSLEVADIRRKAEFESKVSQTTFSSIKPLVKFLDYDLVSTLHNKVSESALAEQILL